MEIPGMGHIWNFSIPNAKFNKERKGREVLQELAKEFLRKAALFLEDPRSKR